MVVPAKKFSIMGECKALQWGLWQCPPFLFVMLGIVTIASMLAAALLSSRYFEDPETPTVLFVSGIAISFLVMGNFIISGFNRIAEANRMKSQFISIASHQLRTPLVIFKWSLEALDHTINRKHDYEEAANYMRSMTESTEKMIRLVNALLDVSRIEAGRLIMLSEEYSVIDLTASIIKSFKPYADASHISIAFTHTSDIPMIMGDRLRISVVIENLIDNAVRYMAGGGNVNVYIERRQDRMRWSVHDAGIGIPSRAQRYIFQKFFRAENSRTHQTDGNGIGLYVARAIVKASGGSIGFESQEGKGSKFWFELPLNKLNNQ